MERLGSIVACITRHRTSALHLILLFQTVNFGPMNSKATLVLTQLHAHALLIVSPVALGH